MKTFSALLALCAGNSLVPEVWCLLWSAPWINGCANNRETGALRRHRAHFGVIVMSAVTFGSQYTASIHVFILQSLSNIFLIRTVVMFGPELFLNFSVTETKLTKRDHDIEITEKLCGVFREGCNAESRKCGHETALYFLINSYWRYELTSISKSLLVEDHFLVWPLNGWELCCQQIESHVRKLWL